MASMNRGSSAGERLAAIAFKSFCSSGELMARPTSCRSGNFLMPRRSSSSRTPPQKPLDFKMPRGDLVVDGARCETFGNSLTSQPEYIIGRNIADQAPPELDGKRRNMVLKSFKALWRQGIL